MKYILETTESGCKATLEFEDDKLGTIKLERNIERTPEGCSCKDSNFVESMNELGYCEEILDKAEVCFNSFRELGFIELAMLMK